MNTEIVFERAKIMDVKVASAAASHQIKFVAIATAKIARSIGASWLLDKKEVVRSGFILTKSDFTLASVRLKHSFEKSQVEQIAEKVSQFKVFRTGDGKKQSKSLMIQFVAHVSGGPFDVMQHWHNVGEGEGVCTLIPLQSEMFDEPAKNGKATRPPKERKSRQGTLASAAEVDRKSSAKRERVKKGKSDPDREVRVKLIGPDKKVAFEGTGAEFKEAVSRIAGEADPA